jgi:hypothetical protein
MISLTRDDLETRKAALETALQQAADEYQRLIGAIQLIVTLISEMDDPKNTISLAQE